MSRKNKAFRAWQHQNPGASVAEAWDAAWASQQATFYSRSMQDKDARIAELEARLAAAERDAERYQWLREQCSASGNLTIARVTDWDLLGWSGDDLDAAIDSARGQHANSK